jgi:putative peptidoglycan lipid II flippase
MPLIKQTASVSALTLSSRMLGVIRDACIAMILGTTAVSDAFFIAFRPFDLLRKMFSDGVFSISFIPPFSRYVQTGRQDEAVSMVTSALGILSVISAVLILAGWFLAPWVLPVLAPGFLPGGDQLSLTLTLFRIMMPYLWVILMLSVCMGVLNTLGNFWVPGSTPMIFNLVVILCALMATGFMSEPVIGIAMGVIAGGGVQLAFQMPFMVRYGMVKPARFVWFHPKVTDSLKKMIPCMVGASPYQVNMLVISLMASFLVDGSVSCLYYADRLIQFPVALIAVSVSTVLLPFFSRKAAAGEITHIRDVFDTGIRLAVFGAIPAMAGLMILNEPIVKLLFGQGEFDTPAVIRTAEYLLYLAPGMGAFIGTRLLVTLHYALDSTWYPFHAGLIAMGLNLVCAPVLMSFMGGQGLALAVTVSSTAGFFFLMGHSPAGINLSTTGILVSGCRALFLSAIMIVAIQGAKQFFLFDDESKLLLGAQVMACVLLGMGIVWIGARILRLPEVTMAGQLLSKRCVTEEKGMSHGPH